MPIGLFVKYGSQHFKQESARTVEDETMNNLINRQPINEQELANAWSLYCWVEWVIWVALTGVKYASLVFFGFTLSKYVF